MKQLKDSTLIWLSTNCCRTEDRIKYNNIRLKRAENIINDMTERLSIAAEIIYKYIPTTYWKTPIDFKELEQ